MELDMSFPELVETLATDDEQFKEALAQVGMAKAVENVAKEVCATKARNFTLRNAVDEAARKRYEEKGQVKHAVIVNGENIGDYTVVLTKESDSTTALEVENWEDFVMYVSHDKETLISLVESNASSLLAGYIYDGVVPDGCRITKTEAKGRAFKYAMLKIQPRSQARIAEKTSKLLAGGE